MTHYQGEGKGCTPSARVTYQSDSGAEAIKILDALCTHLHGAKYRDLAGVQPTASPQYERAVAFLCSFFGSQIEKRAHASADDAQRAGRLPDTKIPPEAD